MVIVTKGLKEREIVKHRLEAGLRVGRWRLVAPAAARGAPGEWSAGRLSGAVPRPRRGPAALRDNAEGIAAVMRAHPNLRNVNFDWNDRVKSVRVEIDQERARALGVASQDVALMPAGLAGGRHGDPVRENDQLIDVVWRADSRARRGGCRSAQPERACPTSTSCPPAGATSRWPRWRAWCRCWRKA
jgi:hypothetical protein